LFGLSGFEIAIILFFGFLIFGPDKLPQIARTIGRGLKQFRTAQEQMSNVIKSEIYDPVKDLEPLINPFGGFSLDNILEGDSKKSEPQKTDTKVVVSKSGEIKKISDDKATEATQNEPKISSEELQAAIRADAEKAKKKALRETAAATAGSTSSAGSFAERRARLEKEYARMKAEKAKAEQAEQAGAAGTGTQAGAATTGTSTGTQAGAATTSAVASETGKEDEKGN